MRQAQARCQVCQHAKAVEIEREVSLGASLSEVARAFGVSVGSLSAHMNRHPPKLQLSKTAARADLLRESMDVAANLAFLWDNARNGLARAEEMLQSEIVMSDARAIPDAHKAIAGARDSCLKVLALQARLKGELAPPQINVLAVVTKGLAHVRSRVTDPTARIALAEAYEQMAIEAQRSPFDAGDPSLADAAAVPADDADMG